jgi:hypothetical protein
MQLALPHFTYMPDNGEFTFFVVFLSLLEMSGRNHLNLRKSEVIRMLSFLDCYSIDFICIYLDTVICFKFAAVQEDSDIIVSSHIALI